MTATGEQIAAPWKDQSFAAQWAAQDSFADMLVFPRRLAAALVAQERPQSRLVIDVASGPGAFLAAFLEEFPEAHGVWTDASEAMREQAQQQLTPFADRVDYRLVDMTDLGGAGLPTDADVLVTSRAAHHLDRSGLESFYRQAAAHLRPGGWLVNLDHIGPSDVWDKRLRTLRKQFVQASEGPKHHHNYPLTSVSDHVESLQLAGLTDVDVPWRAFYTVLIIARKDD